MTTTTSNKVEYPTANSIVSQIKDFISIHDVIVSDWDEFVYEFLSEEYDERFADDSNWYSEDETDIKDQLRDEVLELLGV